MTVNQKHRLLEGAMELHAHSSPSIFPRRQNDWELIEDVAEANMHGIVLKAHEGETYSRAALLKEKYPSIDITGGLVCNLYTGGVNSFAVDMALRMGARIIWMPTISAAQHQNYFARHHKPNIFNSEKALDDSHHGLSVINHQGSVKDEVKQVLTLIAEHEAVLATGHLPSNEVLPLIEEAKSQGIERLLVQHVDLGISPYTLEEQKHLADLGCLLEKCYLACSEDFHDITIQDMAASIQQIGAEHCVLVTDYGQAHHIPVVDALGRFIEQLMEAGITEKEIISMVQTNPKVLISDGKERMHGS